MLLLNTYILPEELKKEFRKPYGRIYTSPEQIKNIIKNKKVISVGDIVSYNLIKSGIKPDIIVFDKKISRKPITPEIEEVLEGFEAVQLSVKNPKSSITQEMWNVIKKSLRMKQRVKILVDGEEDLAVTPFVLESDENTVILYGLMDKGFVLVNVNKDIKQECKTLLSKFRKGR